MSKTYPRNRYVPGTYKIECAICGFDFLRNELVRRWDGVWVCKEDYEEKDPQLERRSHSERKGIVDIVLNNDASAEA